MIDYLLHHAGDALGWFSIAWNPERPQHPEVAYAAKPRDATLAAIRKLLDAEDASLAIEDEIERHIEDAQPEAPAVATDIDGIRRILNKNLNGGVVVIDYVSPVTDARTSGRRIKPREIRKRTPKGGMIPEEYVIAEDLTRDNDSREFYLSGIERAAQAI